MKQRDIEPGMVLRGALGEIREVVKLDGKKVTYRLLDAGRTLSRDWENRKPGSTRTITLQEFAAWAWEEYTVIATTKARSTAQDKRKESAA